MCSQEGSSLQTGKSDITGNVVKLLHSKVLVEKGRQNVFAMSETVFQVVGREMNMRL